MWFMDNNMIMKYQKYKPKVVTDIKGQSLLELTICLPMILILLSGLTDLGQMLLSTEYISDGVTFGTVRGYLSSKESVPCDKLTADAVAATKQYLSKILTPEELRFWDEPKAVVSTKSWRGFESQTLEVSMSLNSKPNCVFCFQRLLTHVDYSVHYTYFPFNKCIES